jgi:hypothetical protein
LFLQGFPQGLAKSHAFSTRSAVGSWREITRAGGKSQEPLLDLARPTRNFDQPIQASRRQAVSDDNLDALRQDKASDPNVRRLTQDEIDAWIYEDSKKPITKREGKDIVKAIEGAERQIVEGIEGAERQIVEGIEGAARQIDDAILAIHKEIHVPIKHGAETNKILAETNKLLAETNNRLKLIMWGVGFIAGLIMYKLLPG